MTDESIPLRLAPYVNLESVLIVERAERGDPEALQTILSDLKAFCGGKIERPDAEFALYLYHVLEQLLDDTDLWEGAIGEFKRLPECSPEDAISKSGPRIPATTRQKIGRALCQAVGLSKPQGQGKKHHLALIPRAVEKLIELRLYGASLRRALKVVRSAYSTLALSDRQIKSWLKDTKSWTMPKAGTLGFSSGQHPRRVELATLVSQRIRRGMSMEEACSEVARLAVTELCFLPTATVFLDPRTVRQAYDYASARGLLDRSV